MKFLLVLPEIKLTGNLTNECKFPYESPDSNKVLSPASPSTANGASPVLSLPYPLPATCNLDEGLLEDDVRLLVDNTDMYAAWAEEAEPDASHNCVPIIGCKFNDRVHNGLMPAERLRDLGEALNHAEPQNEE